MTPLMKAVGPGHIEVVEILVNAGAKLDLRDIVRKRKMNNNTLHTCARSKVIVNINYPYKNRNVLECRI